MEPRDTPQEISDARQVQRLLQTLRQSGHASLYLEGKAGTSWPVKLLEMRPGRDLRLDIGTAAELGYYLSAGAPFCLVGQADCAMVRTAPIVILEQDPPGAAIRFSCGYPETVEMAHRRGAFRAALNDNMEVTIDLVAPRVGESVQGELKNLSMGGCLMEMPLAAAVNLNGEQRTTRLTARFPNGQHLEADGHIRYVRPNGQWTAGLVGYEFSSASQNFERQVWYFVHEIERQRVRDQSQSDGVLSPSELFLPAGKARRNAAGADRWISGGGPMARGLGKIAAYLDAQLLQLQSGAPIALKPLLRQSEALLDLLDQHREALLYATGCLSHEPVVVQHGLAVAVRLADMAVWQKFDSNTLRAAVACALIHDLGKALLPVSIVHAPGPLSTEQRAVLNTHVQLLTERLTTGSALPADVVAAVIEIGNERLDGSGYPLGRNEDDIPELSRMMAVADVADAMRRDRADRPALPQREVYRHLLLAQNEFDNAWVQRYIKRFGMTPIGALVKYSSGKLGWVQRLDADGKPTQVKVVMNLAKHHQPMDQTLHAQALEQLGRIEEVVEAHDYGLKPDWAATSIH